MKNKNNDCANLQMPKDQKKQPKKQERRIVARELAPENADFRYYFEDDGLTSAGGENCAVFILPIMKLSGFNMEEYKEIQDEIERIISVYNSDNDVKNAISDDLGSSNNLYKLQQFEKWIKYADASDVYSVIEYLTIKTEKQWDIKSFTGYCQGDYCQVVYCADVYEDASIEEIGKMWLGRGTEFCIDGLCGYYVIDTIRGNEDETLVNLLADYAECSPEELEVQLYVGSHVVHDYETLDL